MSEEPDVVVVEGMTNVRANVVGLLTVVNEALYKRPRVVIDELLQNADRAGATSVLITTIEPSPEEPGIGLIRIEDNGSGIEHPDVLLQVGMTRWKDTGMVQPFGMGFWSTLLLADLVTVASGDWIVIIDAKKLRDTREDEGVFEVLKSPEGQAPREGACVTLYGPFESAHSTYDEMVVAKAAGGEAVLEPGMARRLAWDTVMAGLKDYVTDVVRFMRIPAVLYRALGYAAEHHDPGAQTKALLEVLRLADEDDTGSPTNEVHHIPSARSPLVPFESADPMAFVPMLGEHVAGALLLDFKDAPRWFTPGVHMYYEGRKVCLSSQITGVSAIVEVTRYPGIVPTAPDRQGFVMNAAFLRLQDELAQLIRGGLEKVAIEAPWKLGPVPKPGSVFPTEWVLEHWPLRVIRTSKIDEIKTKLSKALAYDASALEFVSFETSRHLLRQQRSIPCLGGFVNAADWLNINTLAAAGMRTTMAGHVSDYTVPQVLGSHAFMTHSRLEESLHAHAEVVPITEAMRHEMMPLFEKIEAFAADAGLPGVSVGGLEVVYNLRSDTSTEWFRRSRRVFVDGQTLYLDSAWLLGLWREAQKSKSPGAMAMAAVTIECWPEVSTQGDTGTTALAMMRSIQRELV